MYFTSLRFMQFYGAKAVANTPLVMTYLKWIRDLQTRNNCSPVILDQDYCIRVL